MDTLTKNKNPSRQWQKRMKEWKSQVEELQLFHEEVSAYLKQVYRDKDAEKHEQEVKDKD